MVWVDYVIIGTVIFSSFIGLIHGFVRGVLFLTTWGCAFFIAKNYYKYLAIYFTQLKEQIVRNIVAITLLFLIIIFLGEIIHYIISLLINRIGLSYIDRIFGVFFGVLLGIFIVSMVLFFLDTSTISPHTQEWKNSQLIPYFIKIIKYFFTI